MSTTEKRLGLGDLVEINCETDERTITGKGMIVNYFSDSRLFEVKMESGPIPYYCFESRDLTRVQS